MDSKRILLIILFLGSTVLLGFLLYRVFFYAAPEQPIISIDEGRSSGITGFPDATDQDGDRVVPPITGGGLPPREARENEQLFAQDEIQDSRVKQVVSDFLSSPTASAGGGAQFYNEQDGRFYKIGKNGQLELLSDQVFFNVDSATWDPQGSKAILEYPDGSNIYYNFDTEEQATLPKHWEEFSFSTGGDQIAAKSLGLSPENRWLVVADPDGSGVRTIERLGNNQDKVTVDWSPARDVVGFSKTGAPLGADRQEILLVGQHGENFKSLVVEGRGFESQWSPTGQQLLYSVHSGRSNFLPEIWISDAQGDDIGRNRRPLSLNTWAEKCTFGTERFLYCGVPTDLEAGIAFAPELAENIPDELFRIDTQTGIKTRIELDDAHVIDNIFVGEDGQSLYFTDKTQQGIFEVSL